MIDVAVQSAQTPLGFDAADLIAVITVVVTIGIALLTAIGVLMLRTLNNMDDRISEVKSDATEAVKDLRRDLSSDLDNIWHAIRSPATAGRAGPPDKTASGGERI